MITPDLWGLDVGLGICLEELRNQGFIRGIKESGIMNGIRDLASIMNERNQGFISTIDGVFNTVKVLVIMKLGLD